MWNVQEGQLAIERLPAIGHPSFQCLEPGTGLRNLKKGGPQRPWHMDKLQVFKRKVTVEKGQWRKLWRWPSAVTS